jgi:Chemoreceptor zinc-binding domain
MEWFGLFEKEEPAKGAATVQPAMVEGVLAGLSLQQALEAHQAWRARLQKVLDGDSEEKFDVEFVSSDNQCALGKWIYGEAKNLYSKLPEYEFVRKAHAEFHVCAGEVLTQHKAGNLQDADTLLKTKFRTATNKNQMLLTNFFRVVKSRSS